MSFKDIEYDCHLNNICKNYNIKTRYCEIQRKDYG